MQHSTKKVFAARLLSLLSCASGGIFLGVCLLDLFPLAKETFEKIKNDAKLKSEYPFTELVIGLGFFFVYFVEEIAAKLCVMSVPTDDESYCPECSECQTAREIQVDAAFSNPPLTVSEKTATKSRANSVAAKRLRTSSVLSNRLRTSSVLYAAKQNIVTIQHSVSNDIVRSITFVTAFSFHSTLEGFAFGVQDSTLSAVTLFFGIIVHKAVVTFSIGMRLVRSHPDRRFLIIGLIIFVAFTAPIGGIIGIAVQNSRMDELPKNIVSTVLTCVALGTFLYITFFEV
ncbi:unnamed protein product [Enterobius vermicularis]|uniref:Zinc transporter ZIP3 n=1 Tax=Enterobius vermicularis TaxID=51028 RepID=A0A0N4V701_ENTVE|nr:unnamed protein product [Enterobius vermicularis]